ncbi:hypothetical protein DPMN_138885 [Dreissena polymorpha]|uniref:Uncharacterized protein n=1 Tax=Dreissena polymorpha TaxID=45954 RepID=A0A9D4G4N6_DREPO|nr:hypothetical protein DPMN_138885 [Dreissena polymorpha]
MAEYVRYGMSKALVCCASGFHSIQWHILNASEVWLPYPPETWGTDTPKTEEDGQVQDTMNQFNSGDEDISCHGFPEHKFPVRLGCEKWISDVESHYIAACLSLFNTGEWAIAH